MSDSEVSYKSDSRSQAPAALLVVVLVMGLVVAIAWWVVLVEVGMALVRYFVALLQYLW